jgi:hypothetical protein
MPIKDEDAARCKLLGEGDELSMLIMPQAGKQLLRWSSSDLARTAHYYERIFIHLLEGMVIYQDAGIIHNDIHLANILVDSEKVARYIDFGQAFKLSEIKTMYDTNIGTSFRPKYIMQSPELHLWKMMLNGIREYSGISEMKQINPEYMDLVHQFPRRELPEKTWSRILHNNEYFRKRDIVAFLRTYGKRCDSWRIGLCMWFLWTDLLKEPALFRTSPIYNHRDSIRRALDGLTDFDIDARWDARRALRELDPTNPMVKVG